MALLTSLISYWKMDEASGNAVDAHNGNVLTAENAPPSVAGLINTARGFTAASSQDFVRNSNSSLQTGDIDFTLMCWVYLTDLTTVQTIIAKYGDDSSNAEYALFFNGAADASRRFAFTVVDAAQNQTTVVAENFNAPDAATWYQVWCWHDAVLDTLNIAVVDVDEIEYLDSVAYSAGVAVSTAPFRVGALGNTAGLFYSGRVDEVAFWKRTVTGGERVTMRNGGVGLAYSFGETVPAGFDGIVPVGFMALMLTWSGVAGPPVFTAHSKIPIARRRSMA